MNVKQFLGEKKIPWVNLGVLLTLLAAAVGAGIDRTEIKDSAMLAKTTSAKNQERLDKDESTLILISQTLSAINQTVQVQSGQMTKINDTLQISLENQAAVSALLNYQIKRGATNLSVP